MGSLEKSYFSTIDADSGETLWSPGTSRQLLALPEKPESIYFLIRDRDNHIGTVEARESRTGKGISSENLDIGFESLSSVDGRVISPVKGAMFTEWNGSGKV
ncbi:MAG: hypothetical protein V2G42_07545 [bacterium JZ-2024 1]